MTSDAVSVPAKGIAADKEQVDQRKVSGQNTEEGGEATSSGSLKSPVTPAALCEANGTPALRWKSYTAKQKDLDGHGKLAGASATLADSKGKLVINLCSSSRSSMVPTSLEVKVPTSSDVETKRLEASDSTQEHCSLPNEDEDGPSSRVPIHTIAPERLPSGSSESVQNFVNDLDLCTSKHPSMVNELAKKVCRRIRMVSRTVRASQNPETSRSRKKPYAKEVKSSEFNHAGALSISNHKAAEEPDCNARIETAGEVDKEVFFEGTRGPEDQHVNAALECEDATGSEEVIYSEDEERSFDGLNHLKASACLASDETVEFADNKLVSSACTASRVVALADVTCGQHMPVSAHDVECTSRDAGAKDFNNVQPGARSLSHDPGTFSETSKLDMKEQTVLETLLRDEPPGYSSGGGSEPSRSHKKERSCRERYAQRPGHDDSGQSDDTESTDADSDCSQSDGYDEGDSASSESYECDDDDCNCTSMLVSPRKVVGPTEQVPSVLCDAEGNVWHIGKRAEQARGTVSLKQLGLPNTSQGNISKKVRPLVVQELDLMSLPGKTLTPYSQEIEFNWKWPSDADYTINSPGDVSNRSMVYKEKAIFVGCIPDGTDNLEEVLRSSMEKFLERFDFAPATLSQIQLVKAVKDFAFLELATEKVAHIVLAANQLDVYEWGVNGFHFNIEGCKGTHTSVRPLIEYMPLKPARVIFVGNIPKSRWQKDYLAVFFARILKGGDGPADCNFVNCVYLLPESCDAYVELASEVMADAIIFKCTKNPLVLKQIGDDVFICRDPSSVPMMSKHKGNVCPQRSLYIGVSAPGQEFKIDMVRKVFEEILPMISRETNQPGYLEYISVQPGKDYAFFQFNSESIVDAVMQEYIVNTQLFVCNSISLSYIILRPPGYERLGARYQSAMNRSSKPGMMKSSTGKNFKNIYQVASRQLASSIHKKQFGIVPVLPRRFGDEPAKKTDCIMSIGASPVPEATWNGFSSTGACSADPECMLVVEGLPKGLSYKLLRGALNELFEKCVSKSGLLEVGMLVLRHLDRDSDLTVVASLPNPKLVKALLSLRETLLVAGTEIKLLPRGGRSKVTWKGMIAEHGRGQGEVSCLSDDEVYQDERLKGRFMDVTSTHNFGRRKRGVSHIFSRGQIRKNPVIKRNDLEMGFAASLRRISPSLKKDCKEDVRGSVKIVKGALKVLSTRRQIGTHTSPVVQQCRENTFRGVIHRAKNITGPLKFGKRALPPVNEDRSNEEDLPSEILRIVSEGGKRKIQSVSTEPKLVRGLGRAGVLKVVNKRRKLLHLTEEISAPKTAFMQRSFKNLRQVPQML